GEERPRDLAELIARPRRQAGEPDLLRRVRVLARLLRGPRDRAQVEDPRLEAVEPRERDLGPRTRRDVRPPVAAAVVLGEGPRREVREDPVRKARAVRTDPAEEAPLVRLDAHGRGGGRGGRRDLDR